MALQHDIEQAITAATGETAECASFRTVSGGCINHSQLITLKDGRVYFLKTLPEGPQYPGMFAAEFKALELLAATQTLRVPRPVCCDLGFIVVQAYREGTKGPDWHETLGRRLAELHARTRSPRFGFEMDNYIGTTQQPNTWTSDWLGFWRDQRLGWQLEMYARKAGAGDRLLQLGDRVLVRLDALLGGVTEDAVLLHGDLWSGNSAADENGDPVIFDPASYYGHREAEFGIMRMFGGYGPRCEAAYDELWPREPGADERINLYRLYHELNHLNLFGRGYYQGCIDTMEKLV